MIAISIKSKKALKELIGTGITHLIVETSMFGREYDGNAEGLPYVGPSPYERKFFGQIWTEDGVLKKCK